jgi:hypothetical protein
MATKTNLLAYSVSLSRKLRAEVSDGTEDRAPFTSEMRLDFIEKAYGRLRLIVETVAPDLLQLIFPDIYKRADLVAHTNGEITLNNVFDIVRAYLMIPPTVTSLTMQGTDQVLTVSDLNLAEVTVSGTVYSLFKINPVFEKSYYDLIAGELSEYYDPAKKYYRAIIERKMVIHPVPNTNCRIRYLYRQPAHEFNLLDNDDTDLYIPREYKSLLLTLAAQEACYDDGSDTLLIKAERYDKEIDRETSLLKFKQDRIEKIGRKEDES